MNLTYLKIVPKWRSSGMKLFDKIRILRKARGLSQEQLGYSLSRVNKDGISRQTVSDWENGKFEPKLENIRDLAEVFDVSFDALLDESVNLENEEVLQEVLNKRPYKNRVTRDEEFDTVAVKEKRGIQIREVVLFIIAAVTILFGSNYIISAITRLVLLTNSTSYILDAALYLAFGAPALVLGIVALVLLINAIRRDAKPKVTMVLLLVATSWLVISSLVFDIMSAISWYQSYQMEKERGYESSYLGQLLPQLIIAYSWELIQYVTLLVLSILCFKKFENKKPF